MIPLEVDEKKLNLDPRVRFIYFLSLLLLAMYGSTDSYVLSFLLLSAVLSVRPADFGRLLSSIKYFLWLMPLTFGFHLIFRMSLLGGTGNSLSPESLAIAGFFTVRVLILILAGGFMISTIDPDELSEALRKSLGWLKRFKVPVDEISMIFLLTLSFAPIISDQATKIRDAQKARGITGGKRLKSRVQGTLPIVVPLFLLSISRAEALALALEARGYKNGIERTTLKEYRFRAPDYIFGVLPIAAIIYLYS